jgi:hypothetical protein
VPVATRLYWRDTQTEANTGGANWDLSETQGTTATVGVSTPNSDTYALVGAWRLTVDDTITGDSFPTSFEVTARTNGQVRIRVSRSNSAGTIQASSAFGADRAATGTFTETLTLATTWSAGDQLVIEMQGRRAPGTHGGDTVTIGVNRTTSFVDADFAVPIMQGCFCGQRPLEPPARLS